MGAARRCVPSLFYRLVLLFLLIGYGGAEASFIEGYTWPISAAQGETVGVYVSTDAPAFDLFVQREGVAPEVVTRVFGLPGKLQSVPPLAYSEGCHWEVSYQLAVDPSWRSGVYSISLKAAGAQETYATFTVRQRDPGSTARLLFVNAVSSWQAYNGWGGKSLYKFNSTNNERSTHVSFLRPYGSLGGKGHFPRWEAEFVRWLEGEGYAAEYATCVDVARSPEMLARYRLVVLVGHDEYWSKRRRDAIEAHLASGRNLAVFSGNTCWWQIRYSDDFSRIICYKESELDPLTGVADSLVTTHWFRWPVLRPESLFLGATWLYGGFVNSHGYLPSSEGYGGYTIQRPEHWVFWHTHLRKGDVFGQEETIVGYEADGARLVPGSDPPRVSGEGGTPLSFQVLATSPAFNSMGQVGPIVATMGILEGDGRGTVFNAATTDWSDGLKSDAAVAQITRNVLDRLLRGAQTPVSLQSFSATPAAGGILLTWSFSAVVELEGIDILRRAAGGGRWRSLLPAGPLPSWQERYLDASVVAGEPYTYRLVGLRADGEGVVSQEVNAGAVGARDLVLLPSEPNPFRGATRVHFRLARPSTVRLWVADLAGHRVCSLLQGRQPAGTGQVTWAGLDGEGRPVAAGTYFCVLEGAGRRLAEKMVLLRP